MTEKPILFSGPMVRAILDGRKTQTRRVILPKWSRCLDLDDAVDNAAAATGAPYAADRLWVRETWRVRTWPLRTIEMAEGGPQPGHRFSNGDEAWWERWGKRSEGGRWQPSIYMPRWASRITLAVESIRVERLNDITEEDALAEGVDAGNGAVAIGWARRNFADLWESINGKRTGCAWADDPWVWRIGFSRVTS